MNDIELNALAALVTANAYAVKASNDCAIASGCSPAYDGRAIWCTDAYHALEAELYRRRAVVDMSVAASQTNTPTPSPYEIQSTGGDKPAPALVRCEHADVCRDSRCGCHAPHELTEMCAHHCARKAGVLIARCVPAGGVSHG